MTASSERRRRRTIVGAVLSAVAAVLVIAITAAGATSLANSRAGRDAGVGRLAEVRIPATPTALVAAIDESGRLVSTAALILAPGGVGGNVVAFPASADSSLGVGDDRRPLAETLEIEGVDAFVLDAEAMTALSFDVVEVVTPERLAELVGFAGSVTVDLPADVVSADGADPVATAGPATLAADEMAAVLTTLPDGEPVHLSDPSRVAVWAGLADSVGPGTGAVGPAAAGTDAPTPDDLDEFVERLFSGRVGVRLLSHREPAPERNPRGVDVVVLDRAEVLLVFSQLAPGRVAAPNESLTFRIVAEFSDEDLDDLGLNNSDVVRDVINRLLFVQANVVSVSTGGPGPAPDVTRAFVADPTLLDQVEEGWSVLLGEVEVEPADARIPGVDAVIVLGRSHLDLRRAEAATGTTVPGGVTEPTELGPTDDDDDDERDDGGVAVGGGDQ